MQLIFGTSLMPPTKHGKHCLCIQQNERGCFCLSSLMIWNNLLFIQEMESIRGSSSLAAAMKALRHQLSPNISSLESAKWLFNQSLVPAHSLWSQGRRGTGLDKVDSVTAVSVWFGSWCVSVYRPLKWNLRGLQGATGSPYFWDKRKMWIVESFISTSAYMVRDFQLFVFCS